MSKSQEARKQAEQDIRAYLKTQGKLFINVSVKQLRLIALNHI